MAATAVRAVALGHDVRLSALGDERLARRIALGDERAFAALYERYHQPVFRYCRSILRDDGDAQDALQSTFESAFAALARGRRDAPLRPWLFRIAHNQAITITRRRKAVAPPVPEGQLPAAASAEQEAAERARLAALVQDLSELPERMRGALVMRELGGLSHEDIGLALGISSGAAKQTIFEARRALLELARGREMDCDDVRRRLSDGYRRVLRGRGIKAHLRDCSGCASFASAMSARRADLRCLAPGLPPAVAAAIFVRAVDGLSASGGGGGAAGSAAGITATGKGLTTAALSSKAVAGAAVVTTAAVGAGGVAMVSHFVARHRVPAAPAARLVAQPGAAAPARAGAPGTPPGRVVIAQRGAKARLTSAGSTAPGAGEPPTVARRRSAPRASSQREHHTDVAAAVTDPPTRHSTDAPEGSSSGGSRRAHGYGRGGPAQRRGSSSRQAAGNAAGVKQRSAFRASPQAPPRQVAQGQDVRGPSASRGTSSSGRANGGRADGLHQGH